jgi:hypothetical protein
MHRLNRDVVARVRVVAVLPAPTSSQGIEVYPFQRDVSTHPEDPQQAESVRKVFPEGTLVEHVLEVGVNDLVLCSIAGDLVATIKSALSEEH